MAGRPFNFVNLNNKRFNSLFDTGAKISVISKDVLKNMNIKIKNDNYSKKSLMRLSHISRGGCDMNYFICDNFEKEFWWNECDWCMCFKKY